MLKKTFYWLVISSLLIVFAYYYLDQRVVWLLVAHDSRQFGIFKILANDITLILSALLLLFYVYFAIKLARNKLQAFDKKLLVVGNSILISVFFTESLKNIFGRYWADTFICNNISLVKNHVYGFNWFIHNTNTGSFPSGHTTFITAFAVSMWLLFPKLRWLWAALLVMVISGQIIMYYHFISDVIAGFTIAYLTASYNYYYARHNTSI